jgi:hypothetical protein
MADCGEKVAISDFGFLILDLSGIGLNPKPKIQNLKSEISLQSSRGNDRRRRR